MSNAYELIVVSGSGVGSVHRLPGGTVKIGRSRGNDIVVENDPLVSRQHVELSVGDDVVMAKDLESSQGTLLNEARIRGAVSLSDGDIVQVGDVHFKFIVKQGEVTLPAADRGPAAGPDTTFSGSDTNVGGEEGGDETRYMAPAAPRANDEDDDGDHTQVFEEGATRMLRPDELHGLVPGGTKTGANRKVLLGFVALTVILILGGLFVASRSEDSMAAATGDRIPFEDEQFGFSFLHPVTWKKGSLDDGLARLLYEDPETGKAVARIDLYGDENTAHRLTGLTTGFRDYVVVLQNRHKSFQLTSSKVVESGDVTFNFYQFNVEGLRGKGMYVLNDASRIVVECMSPSSAFADFTALFTKVFQSFEFRGSQRYIDFPAADEATRALALQNKEQITERADERVALAESFMEQRRVRPENLFRAIEAYKAALQYSSALVEKPPVYAKAAEGLIKAQDLFRDAVRVQKFQITQAVKRGDREQAYWEAQRLMQMVPDRSHPLYYDAQRRVAKLKPKR
ncbi:MAG: FHA domain-containing protein [Verrucomicrobia bacterium]|nr:FHA domain-containing protein [Verrucomicrobiota bacterium]MDA1087285.1 FHA domain-containing protein [Verrucomicrobiota bacterium]